jgi:hypothetical protein
MVTIRWHADGESGLKHIKTVSSDIFDIDVHIIPENSKMPKHLHFDIRFLFEANSNDTLTISHESIDLSWIKLNYSVVLTTNKYAKCLLINHNIHLYLNKINDNLINP